MSAVTDAELGTLLKQVFANDRKLPSNLAEKLFELAGSTPDKITVATAVDLAADRLARRRETSFVAVESLMSGLHRNPQKAEAISANSAERLQRLIDQCVAVANERGASTATRAVCIRIIGRAPNSQSSQVKSLGTFLGADHNSQLQLAAINALAERSQPEVADVLLRVWPTLTPALRTKVLDVLLSRKSGLLFCWLRSGLTLSPLVRLTPVTAPSSPATRSPTCANKRLQIFPRVAKASGLPCLSIPPAH